MLLIAQLLLLSASAQKMTALLLSASGSTINTYTALFPERLQINVGARETVRLIAKLNSTQVLLVLEGKSYPFVSKNAKLSLDLKTQSGVNPMVLYDLESLTKWDLGSVIYPVAAVEQASPEISHIFRPDEKQQNQPMAYLFTALTLLPLILLFIGWGYMQANISLLFASRRMMLTGILFFAELTAVLVFLVLYWAMLSVFDLFWYGSILSVGVVASGYFCLSTRAIISK